MGRTNTLGTKERLAALLCVLIVTAGAILALMYMLGFGFASHP